MKRIKFGVLSMAMVLVGLIALPAASYADTATQTACSAITDNKSCSDDSGGPDLNSIITTIINILSIIVGVVAVIMIIVGGLRYITSGGDSNNITSAKNTILYAIIGLVIVALAQFIVQFVLQKVSGTATKKNKKASMVLVETYAVQNNTYRILY